MSWANNPARSTRYRPVSLDFHGSISYSAIVTAPPVSGERPLRYAMEVEAIRKMIRDLDGSRALVKRHDRDEPFTARISNEEDPGSLYFQTYSRSGEIGPLSRLPLALIETISPEETEPKPA